MAADPIADDADSLPRAFFEADGDVYVPSSLAQGPWGEFISGQHIGGLLGRTIERDAGDAEMQLARLTIDLPRRAALEPVSVITTVHRQGRRIQLVDAVMMQGETTVAHARAVFLRRGEHPENQVWSSPISMPPVPVGPDTGLDELPIEVFAYGAPDMPTNDIRAWEQAGQKFMWLRFTTPLVYGEQMTPLTRAAMAADATSALAHYGSTGLHFINADYTLTLSRPPEGPYIGLAGLTHYSHGGVATGVATIFDRRGPVGSSMTVGIANRGFPPSNTTSAAQA